MPGLVDEIEIVPAGPLKGCVRPPGSKSITNRALVCSALANGESRLRGALESEDTRVMVDALGRLGVRIEADWPACILNVQGTAGRIPVASAELYLANSGTSMRFLAAVAAIGHGEFRLDGTPRMRERPIGDLLNSLAQLGVDAKAELGNDCPPLLIRANGLMGGSATIKGDVSSQFLSALLLAAPYALRAVELVVEGPLVSQPYVRLTEAVMAAFGVRVERPRADHFRVATGGGYCGCTYEIEPDASAASYFFAAAAITGGHLTVEGLSRDSLQGDTAFVDVLVKMGCEATNDTRGITIAGRPLRGITIDMNAISDTVPTAAAVALFCKDPTTIRGVAHIRHKETDRLGALATELRKLGAGVDELDDGLTITPRPLFGCAIDTYDDHRMAMALSLVGLRVPGVVIRNPGCTAKTYPRFFQDLRQLINPSK